MIICILYKKFEFKNVSAEQYKLHEKVGLFGFCLHWYYHRTIVILLYVLEIGIGLSLVWRIIS